MSGKSSKSTEKPEAKKNEIAEEKLDKVAGGGFDPQDPLVRSASLQESSAGLTMSATLRRKR